MLSPFTLLNAISPDHVYVYVYLVFQVYTYHRGTFTRKDCVHTCFLRVINNLTRLKKLVLKYRCFHCENVGGGRIEPRAEYGGRASHTLNITTASPSEFTPLRASPILSHIEMDLYNLQSTACLQRVYNNSGPCLINALYNVGIRYICTG